MKLNYSVQNLLCLCLAFSGSVLVKVIYWLAVLTTAYGFPNIMSTIKKQRLILS